jgi:hypothetical protein
MGERDPVILRLVPDLGQAARLDPAPAWGDVRGSSAGRRSRGSRDLLQSSWCASYSRWARFRASAWRASRLLAARRALA